MISLITNLLNKFNIFSTLIIVLLCIIIYECCIKSWNYFETRNVKFIRGLPFLGSFYEMILGKKAFPNLLKDFYNKYPKESFIGLYELIGKKMYLVRDPDIVKQITIKDFDHFTNHRFNVDEHIEPLFGRSLFFMRDNKWKRMRTTLSPAFTGSKMRLLYSLITDCTEEFVNYLNKMQSMNNNKPIEIELKDLFTRFTSDAIASCAFGLNVNSVKDKTNEFYKMGRKITNFDGIKGLKFFGYASMPAVMRFFKIAMIDKRDATYFRDIVLQTFEHREKNNIIRQDMINLLIQAKQGTLKHDDDYDGADNDIDNHVKINNDGGAEKNSTNNKTSRNGVANKATSNLQTLHEWEEDDMIAQCLIFFIAGFDTVSTLLCFLSYELATNPDIQNRLFEEINEMNEKLGDRKISYDELQKLTYLDMVISETLRKWPPAPVNDRITTKPYYLENYNGNKVLLNVGDAVTIPTIALQNDSKYFPDPERFDPERFSDDNKTNIHPGTYLPFGIGPRNCIGSRFALMEIKSLFYNILTNFHLEKCSKTQYPFVYRLNTSNMDAEKGFWFQFRSR